MKIYKLSVSIPAIPDGMALVKHTVFPNGKVKTEIIRGGKSECTEFAGQYLDDLLNTEVPGYEGMTFDVEDEGKTDEFYEQQASKKPPRSRPHRIREKEQDDIIPPVAGPQQETRELDTGFGVGD